MSDTEQVGAPGEIAIVGLAGRFPRARTLVEFWQNLRDGVESVDHFSDAELLAEGIASDLLNNPAYVKAGVTLEDIAMFDAGFFGFSPSEAQIMSPQHRLFLECAWEAMESAGYDSSTFKGEVGVYAGVNANAYLFNLFFNPNAPRGLDPFRVLLLNEKDSLTTWVSYKLNLTGPSINVQTACSTSLVAVHVACQGLLNYQCDMALAGGVNINVPQKAGYFYEEGGISSPDGHTRAFDAQAQGSVSGNGVGVVVLKRLEDARADGDTIHAVIKGSAVNNDGAAKIGFTAPSVQGQSRVIALALATAGIRAGDVSYIETHGSATPLGDQIELAALKQVFGSGAKRNDNKVAIGSVKTNIGHAGSAAGIAGLIKTVLALQHKQLPPSLNFNQPNPQIDFDNSSFYVNTGLTEWRTNGALRRAGVSSFGIGGTNAHVILEEAQPANPSSASRPLQLLLLSARSEAALETATDNLAHHLKNNPQQNLADVAFTLQTGRRNFNFRRMLVCSSREDAVSALESRSRKRVLSSKHEPGHRAVAFMFPGLGNHYVNMARGLYKTETKFREQVDLCCELLKPHLGLDLREVLYPAGEEPTIVSAGREVNFRNMLRPQNQQSDGTTQRFFQTDLSQPALFVVEYALAQLWMSWGVQPQAMIGYSVGEYVAACLAGVLSLADALHVVARRAQMIQELASGAMLAVSLPEKELLSLLNGHVSVAGINGVALTVIAGPVENVAALERQFQEQQIAYRQLPTTHAFHSKMMAPIAASLTELMKVVKLRAPQIPYLSNVTGSWITSAEATDPAYWARHLCQPVRFADGIKQLWQQAGRVLLEVGPGQMLSSLAIQGAENLERSAPPAAFPSLRSLYDQQSDEALLLQTLGQLWLKGVPVNWSNFSANERRRRVPLPTYPFERQRYWVELPPVAQAKAGSTRPNEDVSEVSAQTATLHPRPELGNIYVEPSTHIEQTLAHIWEQLLGVEKIGIHDNFFELGGNSLLGIQVTAQIRKLLQVEVPVPALFEAPTVAELALVVEEILLTEIEGMTGADALPDALLQR